MKTKEFNLVNDCFQDERNGVVDFTDNLQLIIYMNKRYTIGLDYGSDSVRFLIVNVETGEEIASVVFKYPRWEKNMYCDATRNQFRQHPKEPAQLCFNTFYVVSLVSLFILE